MDGDPAEHRRLGLVRGGVLIGRMTRIGGDAPLLHYSFQPTPAFKEVEPLFEAELRAFDTEDMDLWQRDYDRIREPGLALEMPNGALYAGDFVIHVQGDQARLRL